MEDSIGSRKGYTSIPLSFNRKAVRASASVTRQRNVIHCISEVDVTLPRQHIADYFEKHGVRLSFTAYVVVTLAHVIRDYPRFNSFISWGRQVILDDVAVSVLIERELAGETVPEPFVIEKAQQKTYREVSDDIRKAAETAGKKLGGLSGMTWIRFIPSFLLKMFIRLADSNIHMAKRYGKVAVTAVGMFGKDAGWFIPHGSATVLVTVGGIQKKTVVCDGVSVEKELLCLTVSFDHDIIDGAPAARFMGQFSRALCAGEFL